MGVGVVDNSPTTFCPRYAREKFAATGAKWRGIPFRDRRVPTASRAVGRNDRPEGLHGPGILPSFVHTSPEQAEQNARRAPDRHNDDRVDGVEEGGDENPCTTGWPVARPLKLRKKDSQPTHDPEDQAQPRALQQPHGRDHL